MGGIQLPGAWRALPGLEARMLILNHGKSFNRTVLSEPEMRMKLPVWLRNAACKQLARARVCVQLHV